MRVRVSPSAHRADGGRVLVGGTPLRVLRLRRPVTETDADSTLGRRLLDSGIGEPVLDGEPPIDPADLTVVIPARDTDERVRRCRDALAPLRVLVVDDASPVPLPDAAIRLPERRGPAAARNAGLALVGTPYVAFVDADVATSPDELLALSRHFADPEVVLVGPRVRNRLAGARWWQRYDAAFGALDLGPAPAVVRPGSAVGYLPAACLLARTAAVRPSFDESLRLGEDVDLVWRLVADGARVRYDPSVVVEHDPRPTMAAWLRRVADYGTSAAPLAARHGDAVAPAVLSPPAAIAAVALLARTRWALPVVLGTAAVTAARLRRTVPQPTALWLAGRGLGWALRQEASLAVRHWWPAAALAAAMSRRARRFVITALAVDAATALRDRRGLDVPILLAGRRLTDLAYGWGLWRGAITARSARCLLPRRSRGRQPRGRQTQDPPGPGVPGSHRGA